MLLYGQNIATKENIKLEIFNFHTKNSSVGKTNKETVVICLLHYI